MSNFFIDIETRPTDNAQIIEKLIAKVRPPGNYSKQESIDKWWATEGKQAKLDAIGKTALDGTWGRLASFAFAIGEVGDIIWHGGDEHTEAELLQMVSYKFREQAGKIPFANWVAFNGEFDFRFLHHRFVVNHMQLPHLPLGKPGIFYDPMREWAGYREYISQADLELALGIERFDPNTGADIAQLIDVGDWAAVKQHNVEDVRCLREIYRRMNP